MSRHITFATWVALVLLGCVFLLIVVVPLLPLYDLGYTSIGCEPCTTLPGDPGNERSGRWQGQKLECGIHIEIKAQG